MACHGSALRLHKPPSRVFVQCLPKLFPVAPSWAFPRFSAGETVVSFRGPQPAPFLSGACSWGQEGSLRYLFFCIAGFAPSSACPLLGFFTFEIARSLVPRYVLIRCPAPALSASCSVSLFRSGQWCSLFPVAAWHRHGVLLQKPFIRIACPSLLVHVLSVLLFKGFTKVSFAPSTYLLVWAFQCFGALLSGGNRRLQG